uniref:FBA_2 domain-containing protein n=1 Tax=Steinernema glaseri TaxID=37863 RepID=A0A1I8AGM6_9BILA
MLSLTVPQHLSISFRSTFTLSGNQETTEQMCSLIERVDMESVPFAFCLSVVHTLPVTSFDLYKPPVQSGTNHSNLIRLSSAIWREAVLSLSKDEEDGKKMYRVMSSITIFPGKERGMCFCELTEDTHRFPSTLTLRDVESSRFLRSGDVSFRDRPLLRADAEHISLKDAFIKLVIPFSAVSVDFQINVDYLFFIDVLNNLHKHQLVLSSVCLQNQSSMIYGKVETELNNFLTFQIEQGCLRHFYAPDRHHIPFSIPKEVFLKLLIQPQLEVTADFPVAFSTEALEDFVARWKNSSTYCYHESLTFDDNLDHENLQRMGFKEITKWKKLRRFVRAVGFGSRINSYRTYCVDSSKYSLRLRFSSVTRMGLIRTWRNVKTLTPR